MSESAVADTDCTCVLVFTFRTADSKWEKFVAGMTRPHSGERFCHVDVGVHTPEGGDNVLHAYSSYVGQKLTRTRLDSNGYSHDDVALALLVTPEESHTARSFLDALVAKKTGYNYEDLVLCVMPKKLTQMLPDVNANDVTKVFCSQLAVLTIRKSLLSTYENAAIHAKLDGVNSRACSPNALFEMIKPLCQRINIPRYCMGRIEAITR